MAVFLRVVKGTSASRRYVLEEGRPVVLGRSKTADVTVDDPLLSRAHCRVELSDGVCTLVDLNSSNGTQVNGEWARECRLLSGDLIRMGTTVFRVEFGPLETELSAAPTSLLFCTKCYRAVPSENAGDSLDQADFVCMQCLLGSQLQSDMLPGIELIEKTGDSQMGPVYRARHLRLQRDIAVKFILPQRSNNKQLDLFLREAKVYGKLFHPHIIEMLDATEHRGVYYIVTEYVDGETAQQKLERDGPFPLEVGIDVVVKIGTALQFAYEHQIVHRDVKPGHILLGKDGSVRLSGFGLAKCYEDAGLSGLTRPGEGKGTLFYMAPEQITSAVATDWRADIYSLGATLYHILSGHPPFSSKSIGQVVRKILSGDWVPLHALEGGFPQGISDVVSKAMAVDRNDRYATPEAFVAALEAL